MDDEQRRIKAALDTLEAHPALAIGALIGHAEASGQGIYLGSTRLEDGRYGVALGVMLDDEEASRLFNFLHDLTEGVVQTWEEHAYARELLSHPAGVVADDGEA